MLEVIQGIWDRWQTISSAYYRQWVLQVRRFVTDVLSFNALTISTKYPPLPKLFEFMMEILFDTMDLVTNLMSVAPFLAAATLIADKIKVPGELRKRVMTLDQVALVVPRVIVKEGIETFYNPTPNEWTLYKSLDRYIKLGNFIKAPSVKSGWKVLFGSFWGRIVQLIFAIFRFGKFVALLSLLWNYAKHITDETFWPVYFSGALSQQNKRRRERVRIYRRVGGVKP